MIHQLPLAIAEPDDPLTIPPWPKPKAAEAIIGWQRDFWRGPEMIVRDPDIETRRDAQAEEN